MGDIKSAREIAMEKLEKLGEVTGEERLKWQYVPAGEKLAVRYIKENVNLVSELSQYDGNKKEYVIIGAQDILIRNIGLPKNDGVKRANRRALEGLKIIKNDKVGVENVFSKMRRIFDHYAEHGEQQKKQAYESLKAEFGAKVQQAIKQQLGSHAQVNIDIESQPQFLEEWRKMQTQLDLQYIKLLDEYKLELSAIA